jgi:hypothetical protein
VQQLIKNVLNGLRLESKERAANCHASEASSKLAMINYASAGPIDRVAADGWLLQDHEALGFQVLD